MSFPNNMKTGGSYYNYEKEFFHEMVEIILLGITVILKRCSYEDVMLHAIHNDKTMSSKMFNISIAFNLYSKNGIGCKLKPLVKDLFENKELNYDDYKNNIYYKELLKLVPNCVETVRSKKTMEDYLWIQEYIFLSSCVEDEIGKDRKNRIYPLTKYYRENIKYYRENNRENRKNRINNKDGMTECICDFCNELLSYSSFENINSNKLIFEAVRSI